MYCTATSRVGSSGSRDRRPGAGPRDERATWICRAAGALAHVLGAPVASVALAEGQRRSTWAGSGEVVAKRLEPAVGDAEGVVGRWLPAVDLETPGCSRPRCPMDSSPGTSTRISGQPSLEHQADAEHVAVAVHLIALLHARFASHAVLAECRSCAPTANVRDAVRALELLRGADAALTEEQAALRDCLLADVATR